MLSGMFADQKRRVCGVNLKQMEARRQDWHIHVNTTETINQLR